MGGQFKKQLQTPVHQTERRANPRHKVQKSGVVTCKFSMQDYSCKVVNLSVAGATIETLAYAALVNKVTLLVISERIVYDAEVVWKMGGFVGLRLTGEPKLL